MPRKIIVDCDPGHDDAIALLIAHGSPEIELLAVTTVMGDTTLSDVSRNALAIAALGDIRDVPIAAGCGGPLIRSLDGGPSLHDDLDRHDIDRHDIDRHDIDRHDIDRHDIDHDDTDRDDIDRGGPALPLPTRSLDPRHAVDLIIETLLREPPGTVTLVPTAALTNIAMAARREPRIVERVAEVVLIGGAVAGGNRTAAAESNIVTDPEAAHIVFGERWPVTMVGLELTLQAVATPDVVDRIAGLGTTPARYVLEVLEFFGGTYLAEQGLPHPSVHDLCAVARVIDPAVLTTRRAPITVELSGAHTRGMTIADLRGSAPPGCHTQVAVGLDHARFWDLVIDALERIGQP